MPYMFVTLEVSQPERSRDESLVQLSNMEDMPVTLEVSHPTKSRDESKEQPSNM